MEKLSDYFLLSRFKVLLVNFLSKTRKTFDGQRHAKVLFCYCIHSMKSTLLATVVHALFMSSPTDRVALCVYCVLYELWICRADLCDQIIQRYANKLDTENIYFIVCKPNTHSIVDNWLQIYILLMCTSVYFILIPCLISRLCSFTPSTFVRLPHSAVHALPLPTAVRTALETCSAPRPCLGSQWSKLFSSQRAINGAKPCCMQLARLQRRCNSEMVERNHEIRTHVEGIKHTSA